MGYMCNKIGRKLMVSMETIGPRKTTIDSHEKITY